MARCVVLGAAGFIGSVLAQRLIDEGHEVKVVDILNGPEVEYRKPAWQSAQHHLVGDLRDPKIAHEALMDAEYVFYLAADVGGVGYLAHHDYVPFFNNMKMSLNVLESAEKWRVKRLFYTSSSCCYPVHLQTVDTHPKLTEDLIEYGYPDLMYGREKLMTLRLCERAPFDARVGMINSCYGPGLKLYDERMKFPAAVTLKALKSKETGEPIEVWGDGTQLRSYIYVDDTVDKIMTIMFSEQYEGPVNVTTEPPVSCNYVTDLVQEILDIKVPVVHLPSEPTGPMMRDCSNAKWERVYGQDKVPPFEERFEQFVQWMKTVVGNE